MPVPLNRVPIVPPSEYWSPEFTSAHAELAAPKSVAQLPPLPARDATKEEWDRFDASSNSQFAGPLAWNLKHYDVNVVDTLVAGVHVGVISPRSGIPSRNQQRVLINLHGGGFFLNRGLAFGQVESIPIAAIGGMQVVTVDYRQSPFHVYPAATEDVEAVYKELLKHFAPEAIGIYGCSAGGMLSAQVVAWFQFKKLPTPGAVGMFCAAPPTQPCWPFGKKGDSRIWDDSLQAEEAACAPFNWYMQGASSDDSCAYPGSSDAVLAGFPPTLLLVGTREIFLSSAVVAHAKFLELGVRSSLYVIEGGWHGAHMLALGTRESINANTHIARWFDEHLVGNKA